MSDQLPSDHPARQLGYDRLVPGTFTLGDGHSYAGFWDGATQWNGFACPSFRKPEADRIMLDNPEYLAYDVSRDVFLEGEYAFRPFLHDGDRLYPIGAAAWCWWAIDCPQVPTIERVRITAQPTRLGDPLPEVWVTFSDGTEKKLFTYYPDEIAFGDAELIGLTETEALAVKGEKDRAYLRR